MSQESGNSVGVRTEIDQGIARITLQRPETRNALSLAVLEALDAAIVTIHADRTVRVVLLAAEGPVFSSGHDLRELDGSSRAESERVFATCTRMMERLRRLPQPVVARVQGPAVAAGCQLVAACDLAVAVDSATFSTPGVKIGLFCTTPMVPLVRTIAPRAALEMLITGQAISAPRALELGLVNRVARADELDATIDSLIAPILTFSPTVLAEGKAAFYELIGRSETDAYERATDAMVRDVGRAEAREGIQAFLEKRTPSWPS